MTIAIKLHLYEKGNCFMQSYETDIVNPFFHIEKHLCSVNMVQYHG